MSSPATTPTFCWPQDVLDFASRRSVADLLDPLRQAIDRVFPIAQDFRVRLEEDPEIRDDWHVVFEVCVSSADVPDFGAAKRQWHTELFRICRAPLVCLFRMVLIRVTR